MDQQLLIVIGTGVLVALSVGGVLYALLFSRIENEQKSQRRLQSVAATNSKRTAKNTNKVDDANKRRKVIGDALQDMEKHQKDVNKNIKKPPLKVLLKQAGVAMDIRTFYIVSAVIGLVTTLVVFVLSANPMFALGAGFAAGAGMPRWFVGYLRKRRMNAFLLEFPNALDVIVRSIKSGLPLNDGLRLIANEAKEPVRTEFLRIVESQQLGLNTPDACLRMYQSMPVTEANFFAVVIQIQQQAGGNLAEALANLSNVLRARKQMKAKVSAMSMEAKASGAIIGSLPFVVAVLVWLTSPGYLTPLFTEDTGHMILAGSAVWMAIGIFSMKQMINFEV